MASPTLVLTLFTVALVTCNELDSRMYNGEEIGSNEFKFLVQIEIDYSSMRYSCSGSILDAHWIITAAHCVSYPGRLLGIRVSHLRSAPALPALAINSYKRHPNYVPSLDGTTVPDSSIKIDLALLRTTQPIQFNQLVQPIPLGRFLPLPSCPHRRRAVIAGYGQPVMLPRKGEVTLFHCPGDRPILCSHPTVSMPRIGHGDSGGPVVANDVLVGVVSSDRNVTEYLGIWYINYFADIESNYDWIQSVINTQ